VAAQLSDLALNLLVSVFPGKFFLDTGDIARLFGKTEKTITSAVSRGTFPIPHSTLQTWRKSQVEHH
jgi:hypothetical protein